MLILAVDTSGRNGGVALARATLSATKNVDCEIIARATLDAGTYSAHLVPTIARLIAEQQLSTADIEGFAVASGPGSFTGLRVGLAAVKALAEVLKKPIAAVSILEAIAELARASERNAVDQSACVDAG